MSVRVEMLLRHLRRRLDGLAQGVFNEFQLLVIISFQNK
jgi:hypothetical protein